MRWVLILILIVLILTVSGCTKQSPVQETTENPLSAYYKNTNTSLCDRLSLTSARDECLARLAVSNLDLGVCNFPTKLSKKAACYTTIATISNDESICEIVNNICTTATEYERVYCQVYASRIKDMCYIFIAENRKSDDLCNKILNSSMNERCIVSVGKAKGLIAENEYECFEDYDCTQDTEKPHCNKERHICSQCVTDDDCPDGYECLLNSFCFRS